MREIKFRVFDTKNRKWIDENNFFITNNELWLYQADFDNSGSVDTDIYKVMQFTGLLDKNGVEIYEGDFLSTDLSRPYLIVEFRNGAFMYQCHHNHQDYYDFMEPAYEGLKFSTKYHEVIGNIHEHPYLLGGVDK